MSDRRTRATARHPCPACDRTKSCNWEVGGLLFCFGLADGLPPDGWVDVRHGRPDKHGARHLKKDDGRTQKPPVRSTAHPIPKKPKPAPPPKAFTAGEKGKKLTAAQRRQLADHLRLPVEATHAVPFGWDGQAWTWPETDAAGTVVGVPRRFPAKGRAMVPGSTRGLVVPAGWTEKADPVLLVEGMSDALAATHAGLAAVGRPNSVAGVEFLVRLLAGREVLVVGENDAKADGRWPGRDGAAETARALAAAWGRPVRWAMTPDRAKDTRDWLTGDRRGDTPWLERGAELRWHLEQAAQVEAPPRPPAEPATPQPPAVPEYVPFPVCALPERVRPFVRAVAESTGTDPAFTALPLLGLLGSVVGTARALRVKAGWKVFPTVWGMCVGRSSSGKSPPLAILNEALAPLIDELDSDNRQALAEYHEAKARHLTDKSKRGLPPPPEPPAKRLRVSDTTVEALAVTLSHNPRGVWKVEDELSGWFGSFTRYRGSQSSTDRPKWLTLFDGGFLEVDRKTGDPKHISVRNTLVGVSGGIQPGVLRAAMTEENVSSGLFARILLAYPPDRLTEWTDAEVPDALTADLTALLRELRWFEQTEIGGRRLPVLNALSPDALARFKAFFTANRHRAFTGDDGEAAATVKLESYALRFAHIRHLCRYAGRDDSAPSRPRTWRPASTWPTGS